MDLKKHFYVIFVDYVHMYKGTDNMMELRSVGAFAHGLSDNIQGSV